MHIFLYFVYIFMGVNMYKKVKTIGAIIWIFLTFISHFMYTLFPNAIIASFFPINESIWEHMKLFVTPAIFTFIFEVIYMKSKRICIQNNYLSLLIEIMSSTGVFLTIFLPYYYKFNHNIFITLIMMTISIIIAKYLGYIISSEKNELILNIISIPIILIIVIANIILTFNPLKNSLFIDTTKNSNNIAIFLSEKHFYYK